ncbi:hypothetical protein E2C01_034910 [Portunus trituberculatus]|uniref:Uncharacterized protein n=1 Tax=Portunus trituberculatus TaxID=210409 RepID=A0A5B7F444_PORTR|nr:hypothetical protein [Portunus trituberculatus]
MNEGVLFAKLARLQGRNIKQYSYNSKGSLYVTPLLNHIHFKVRFSERLCISSTRDEKENGKASTTYQLYPQ